MKTSRTIAILLCMMLMPLAAMSQAKRLVQDVQYGVSMRGTGGSGAGAPFWFTNNRYGLGPVKTGSFQARTYIRRDAEADSLRNWRIGYGVDVAAGYAGQSEFCIQQTYVDLQWKMLRLSLGQKQRASELKNEELSTGGMTLGTNARPLPQVRLEMPDFWDIPGTKGWLGFKAHVAYGWFTDNRWQRNWNAGITSNLYTQNSMFHSKSLLIKIGNPQKFPLTLKWGIEMACQFGGSGYNIPDLRGNLQPGKVSLGGNIWKAFIVSGGDVNDGVYVNAAGNHVGSWHCRLDWTGKGWSLGAYMDHFFEDHSQLSMQYGFWKDMLLGVEAHLPANPFVSTIVYEHIGTMNQSGPIYHDATEENPQQISANDAYYSNHIYGSWQHGGFVMGNPLILSPMYNEYLGMGRTLNVYFNRINAHHVALGGRPLDWLSWRAMYTYEKNMGSYDKPVMDPLYGHFLLLEATFRPKNIRGLTVSAAYGHNHGNLLGKANGAMLTVSWDGWINKK